MNILVYLLFFNILKISLVYDKGSIIIYGIGQVPFTIFDPRTNQLRAQALHYSNILSYLNQSELQVRR